MKAARTEEATTLTTSAGTHRRRSRRAFAGETHLKVLLLLCREISSHFQTASVTVETKAASEPQVKGGLTSACCC